MRSSFKQAEPFYVFWMNTVVGAGCIELSRSHAAFLELFTVCVFYCANALAMTQNRLQIPSSVSPVKRTRKREFLDQMEQSVPWEALANTIAPVAAATVPRVGGNGCALETMLRVYLLQQWYNLSDAAMEEALHDTPVFREFARFDALTEDLPSEVSILRFRHFLEVTALSQEISSKTETALNANGVELKSGVIVDACVVSSTFASSEVVKHQTLAQQSLPVKHRSDAGEQESVSGPASPMRGHTQWWTKPPSSSE